MINILKNELLKNHTTIKIGGPAKFFCEVKNGDELKEALLWAKENKESYHILGGGSNTIFSDKGYDGLLIRFSGGSISSDKLPTDYKACKIEFRFDASSLDFQMDYEMGQADTLVTVEAGYNLSRLINWALDNNLVGLEWFAGIPGTVGGAVVGNIHGGPEFFSNFIYKVKILDENLEEKELKWDDLEFDYDLSIFQKKNWVILSVSLGLNKASDQTAEKAREFVKKWILKKISNFPKAPNVGSIFQNLLEEERIRFGFPTMSTGWLIDSVDLKGYSIGDVTVSNEHANIFINKGNGTCADFMKLVEIVKNKVKKKFNIDLKLEIKVIE